MAGCPGESMLRRSVLRYMASQSFAPAQALTREVDAVWVVARHTAPATVITPPPTEDGADPGQLRRRGA